MGRGVERALGGLVSGWACRGWRRLGSGLGVRGCLCDESRPGWVGGGKEWMMGGEKKM